MIPPDPTDPEASAQRSRYRGNLKAGLGQKVAHFFRENEWFWAVFFLLVVFALFTFKFRVQPPPLHARRGRGGEGRARAVRPSD